jgi:hypothetical protein
MLRTASLLTSAFLITKVALAGGDSWIVKVVSISPIGTSPVTFVVEPLEDGYEWKGCGRVTITSILDREVNGLRTWSSKVGPKQYQEALAALHEAANAQTPVRLGSMGTGFKPTSEKCSLLSRGLELLTEPSGSLAIYSYHDAV